jgi:type VI secretion system FHA domain protein
MGDIQFEVSIDEGEDLEVPAPSKSFMPEHLELMVDEEPIKSGIQLLDEEELTGDEAFRSTLFGSTARRTQKMVRKPAARPIARPAEPSRRKKPKKAAATPIARGRDGELTGEQLFQIFLDGMGVERTDLHPSTDLAEVMQNAGEVLREFVAGMTSLLISRSNFKSMFKLDQTTILPQRNNPLKVSESTEDSLKQLLVGREGEYLGPLGSVREACRDLKFHHDAMVEAMVDTFIDFVDRFEPSELKEGFDRRLSKKPLIDALNRLRYWQLYCEFYATASAAGEGPLPEQFGEEFVRAYEKQIADFKRLERDASEAA